MEEDEFDDEHRGRLVLNVHCTDYDVIKKVARKTYGYKLKNFAEDHDGGIRIGQHNQKLAKDWDVSWHDLGITADYLAKVNSHQKVNHYPGMQCITRKHNLARNLMRMRRVFPDEFAFFPSTWILPGDSGDFRSQFVAGKDGLQSKRRITYIVKPDGLS